MKFQEVDSNFKKSQEVDSNFMKSQEVDSNFMKSQEVVISRSVLLIFEKYCQLLGLCRSACGIPHPQGGAPAIVADL